jgi:hypothetical protein
MYMPEYLDMITMKDTMMYQEHPNVGHTEDGANNSIDEDRDEECKDKDQYSRGINANKVCDDEDALGRSTKLKKIARMPLLSKKPAIVLILMTVVMIVLPVTTIGAHASTTTANEDYTIEERESGFYDVEGYVMDTELRPEINPDFAPDEDCNLAYELKCIPGSQQKCSDLDGFNNGENNVCTPIECQEGYVGADDDEHGLCISYGRCENNYTGYVLLKDEARCALGADVCNGAEHKEKDYCVEWKEEEEEEEEAG